MAKKNISIDLNQVLRDFTRQFTKMYNKMINPSFRIDYDEITDWDFFNIFPFDDKNEYWQFLYSSDASYELYGCAEVMERNLGPEFSAWVENDMTNFDEDNPNIRIVSPFEMHLSIPSSMHFLARIGCKIRNCTFPIVSASIWDDTDILVTAHPKLITSKPEGKIVIKINTPYNKDLEADYSFDKFTEVMKSGIINQLIKGEK